MNKQLQKEFREVAAQMPAFNYTTKEVQPITGKELKLTGITEVDGKPIEDNMVYDINCPGYRQFNHYRRMKRMYKNNVNRPRKSIPVSKRFYHRVCKSLRNAGT
jgi:hypothetical protein